MVALEGISKAGAPISLTEIFDRYAKGNEESIWTLKDIEASAARRIAVGTTSVRTLESGVKSGETDIFIYPGFHFRAVNAMLTNFHLPKSSLLMLVCAFAGRDFTLAAYEHAVRQGYRFFSYGDCMLIL